MSAFPTVLPTNRDENWRYANLRPLARARPEPVHSATHATSGLPAAMPGYESCVFVDGVWSPDLSPPASHPTMLVDRRDAHNAGDAFDRMLDRELEVAGVDFALARANLAHSKSVLMIHSAADGSARNVELTFVATQGATAGTSYPRVQVQAARGARINLIERHVSIGTADSVVNSAIDIGLATDAQVEHVRLQNCAHTAACFDTLVVNVGERARYALRTITLGALTSRATLFIRLAGRGAACALDAASVAGGIQTHDTFAEIEHVAPDTRTRELYRGIAADRGKLAFNGKMIVRESAHGADSDQSLKTLLTGSGAEAAARPQLEIYTDRVRAVHGATTGKLDDAMLFYLLSRGIDRSTAQALLHWAFIEDPVSRVSPAQLRHDIESLIEARLGEVAALGLLGKP